ncbi:MAG: hypothetical protein ACREC6_06355 [Hyphomicrobiaceae bacterium]
MPNLLAAAGYFFLRAEYSSKKALYSGGTSTAADGALAADGAFSCASKADEWKSKVIPTQSNARITRLLSSM